MWGGGGIMEHAAYRADLALLGTDIFPDVRIEVAADGTDSADFQLTSP